MNGPEFNAELQCTPIRLGYDFTRRVGTIHIMRNDRCDMASGSPPRWNGSQFSPALPACWTMSARVGSGML